MKYLRLVRFHNLLIVALTQYLMRWCVITPLLKDYAVPIGSDGKIYKVFQFVPQLTDFQFFLLVLSTVLLTAAGYVINDYFDRRSDIVNRPESVIVDKEIDRRFALILHVILNTLGVIIGIYLSYSVGHYKFGLIYAVVAGVLWFYSTTYKRQFLVGNLVVSVLTAMVPLMVGLYELAALNNYYFVQIFSYHIDFKIILYWIGGFSFFAFITNLLREIVKDIEDYEGDTELGRDTLPINLGIFYTKLITIVLAGATIISLALINYLFLFDKITFIYLTLFVEIPLLFVIFKITKADSKENYHFISNLLKVIMLFGLLYSVVGNYVMSTQ